MWRKVDPRPEPAYPYTMRAVFVPFKTTPVVLSAFSRQEVVSSPTKYKTLFSTKMLAMPLLSLGFCGSTSERSYVPDFRRIVSLLAAAATAATSSASVLTVRVAAMLFRATRVAPSASTNLPPPIVTSFFKFIGLFLSLLHAAFTNLRQFHCPRIIPNLRAAVRDSYSSPASHVKASPKYALPP